MTLYESHMNYRDEETAKARENRNKINREIHARSANFWENYCREMTIEQAENELETKQPLMFLINGKFSFMYY